MYVLKDNKIGAFTQPFYVYTEEQVERDMMSIANDLSHPVGKNVNDFALYKLGEYDDITGKHNLIDAPKHITNLAELVVTKVKEVENNG